MLLTSIRDRVAAWRLRWRIMHEVNTQLFAYYQRLMQTLIGMGDELYANGIGGLNARFPRISAKYNCNHACGKTLGEDGESALAVESPGRRKSPFPYNWPALREAILYSQDNYGSLDKWWLVNGSSLNLHGLLITGWYPWLHLSKEQFYGGEFAALSDMIHEPLHDWRMYGIGHQHAGKELVPMETSFYGWPTGKCSSSYGSALYQLYWFMSITREESGHNLWSKACNWAGPKPALPPHMDSEFLRKWAESSRLKADQRNS